MECPKCQHENREGAKFCEECGAKLQPICSNCGAELRPQAKFCDECGVKLVETVNPSNQQKFALPPRLEDMHARLQSVIPQALAEKYSAALQADSRENRPVTALFADISGFTPLSTTLSSEAIFQLVEDCFNTLVNIVAGYEGKISGFRGDGLLALFGAPILHENDAERAILAALDMRNAVDDKQLQVSIGINTATMTVGEISTILHSEYTAHSVEVNLAARLQEVAQPDQILVGAGTYRLTRRAFDFQPLEGLSLRGIGEGIVAYEVLHVKEHPEKLRGIEGLRARMIGREREFTDLKEAADKLFADEGQMVSVIGDAGIGKSRLVNELKTYLEEQQSARGQKSKGTNWLEGRCVSIGNTISYWPILDMLRSYFGLGEDENEKAIAGKVVESITRLFPQRADDILPFFGHLMSIRFGNDLDGKLKYFSPEQIMHQTLMRLRDFFVTLAKESPLLLIFEDLHWSDTLSLELIIQLMDELVATPLMLLCIFRPSQETEIEPRLRQLAGIAERKCIERYTEIKLKQLTAQESRQLVETLLTIDNLPELVKEMILHKSEGNPFFIEEVIRSLIDRDLIYREDERWKARREIIDLDVPDTIQSVILARVDRLEAESKYILQCASVIGRLFKYRLLEHLSHQERRLDQYLTEFEQRDLVYEERSIPELEYAFKHALTQETTYQGILEQRRQQFHHRIGQGIEALYRERLEEYYEELAYHYGKSPDKLKALEYLTKSGEKCFDTYATKEAIGYYTDAIKLAHDISVDKEAMAELYQQRGKARHFIGEYEESIEDYKGALEYMEKKDYRAMLYGGIAELYNWHRADRKNAIEYGNLGCAELENAEDSKFVTLAYMSITTVYSVFSNADEAASFCRKGLEIAQKIGDKEALLSLRCSLLFSHRFQDDATFEKVLALIPEIENPYTLAWAYHLIGVRHATYGNTNEARESYHQAINLAEKHDLGWWLSYSYHYLGLLYESVNQIDNAVAAYEKSWNATLRIRNLHIIRADNYPGRLVHFYQQRGKTHKIFIMIEAFVDMMDRAMTKEETEADSPFVQFLDTLEGVDIRGRRQIGYTAIVPSDELRAQCQQRLEKGLEQAENRMAVIWYLYQLMTFHLACENLEDAKSYAYRLIDMKPTIGSPMVKTFLVVDEIESANQVVVDVLQASNQPGNDLIQALQQAESRYGSFGYQDAFRQLCRRFQSENADLLQQFNLTQLCLEPGQPSDDCGKLESTDIFDGNLLSPDWEWIDVTGNNSYTMLSPSGLQITAFDKKGGWSEPRLNAARLLQKISGDFAVETKISPSDKGSKFGGLSVWSESGNIQFNNGVQLTFSQGQQWEIAGRGQLEAEILTLRLERRGHRFSAYCNVDGENWLTCGWVDLPMNDPIQVGIHSIPPATSTRFEYFKILRHN